MAETHEATIEVRGLAKRYGRVDAVRDVTFTVAAGEIFGLLGRNGAGKTTTLECVLGLRRPDGGEVTIDRVDAIAEPERAKAVVGAQLQAATLQDKITARQALRFFASFYRTTAQVDDLLSQFGLVPKADAPFDSLSGGQRQRLFLALAFIHQPKALVLDEPTAGLDPQARRELHESIRKARDAGVAIVLSTHDLDEAERLCDRIGILHAGRLVAIGSMAELMVGAQRKPRLCLRTAKPIPEGSLIGSPGIVRVVDASPAPSGSSQNGYDSSVECSDITLATGSIGRQLSSLQIPLVDLWLERPTLEQVFIELTGSVWKEESGS